MADTPEEIVAEPVTPFEMAKALRVDADRRLDCGLPLAASMLREAADIIERQAVEIADARNLVAMHQALIELQTPEIQRLRAEIAALRETWRPIAEAPKDGRLALFWTRNGGCHIAPSVPPPSRDRLRGLHRQAVSLTGEWPNAGWTTTHWMPLPSPPAER